MDIKAKWEKLPDERWQCTQCILRCISDTQPECCKYKNAYYEQLGLELLGGSDEQ